MFHVFILNVCLYLILFGWRVFSCEYLFWGLWICLNILWDVDIVYFCLYFQIQIMFSWYTLTYVYTYVLVFLSEFCIFSADRLTSELFLMLYHYILESKFIFFKSAILKYFYKKKCLSRVKFKAKHCTLFVISNLIWMQFFCVRYFQQCSNKVVTGYWNLFYDYHCFILCFFCICLPKFNVFTAITYSHISVHKCINMLLYMYNNNRWLVEMLYVKSLTFIQR